MKKLWKNISENRNKLGNISILTVMIEENKLIAGNVGRNKLKIFRENKIFEELDGDKIKEVILKENDYILIGTEMFWELIDEYEICEMLEKFKDRNVVEETLSLKIKKEEKDKKIKGFKEKRGKLKQIITKDIFNKNSLIPKKKNKIIDIGRELDR